MRKRSLLSEQCSYIDDARSNTNQVYSREDLVELTFCPYQLEMCGYRNFLFFFNKSVTRPPH